MYIHQFYNTHIAHASYALLTGDTVILIDPGRDPQPYYDFAKHHGAQIRFILETHPHADFVSSHLQIHQETGAIIGVSDLAGSAYPHQPLHHQDTLLFGEVRITTLHTPGHSPDSNSYLCTDIHTGKQVLFTGDFLFIGDVGRPDLREHVGNIQALRTDLAEKMYTSLHHVLSELSDEVIIYPTHGAGSLCGKNLSTERSDTLGNQRKHNWALQDMTKETFVSTLLEDQPYIPKYFAHCVEINRMGADAYIRTLNLPKLSYEAMETSYAIVIDTRASQQYREGTYHGAINIPAGITDTFETWLGSIISPDEPIIIIVDSEASALRIQERLYTIGYEQQVRGYYLADTRLQKTYVTLFDQEMHPHEDYLMIDIREAHEHHTKKVFDHALNLPLSRLRESIDHIPTDTPIIVHCAGGYRSAIGASIIATTYPQQKVYDMSSTIKQHLT